MKRIYLAFWNARHEFFEDCLIESEFLITPEHGSTAQQLGTRFSTLHPLFHQYRCSVSWQHHILFLLAQHTLRRTCLVYTMLSLSCLMSMQSVRTFNCHTWPSFGVLFHSGFLSAINLGLIAYVCISTLFPFYSPSYRYTCFKTSISSSSENALSTRAYRILTLIIFQYSISIHTTHY